MKRSLKFLIFVVLVFIVAFGLQRFLSENAFPTQVQFLLWRTKEVSLGLLVALSFLSGILLASLFLITALFSSMMTSRRLKRENAALQRMIELKDSEVTPAHQKTQSPQS